MPTSQVARNIELVVPVLQPVVGAEVRQLHGDGERRVPSDLLDAGGAHTLQDAVAIKREGKLR